MIWLYTGTPGSGKTLHATVDIVEWVSKRKHVVANYGVNLSIYKRLKGYFFTYMDNSEITPEFLVQFSIDHKWPGKEGQGLLVIDEASVLFNCREFNAKGRAQWVQFFQQHRKWGWDIIFITQFDRMLDRQIRSFVEYNIIHRKVNNYGVYGAFLKLLHIPLFIAVEFWYGVKAKTAVKFFTVDRKVAKAYNSWAVVS